MKLIHLPTGEEMDGDPAFLVNYPYKYIRAELPQYWRVEGYDKSWEWVGLSETSNLTPFIDFVGHSVNHPQVYGKRHNKEAMQLPEISRAEFEYHIYDPWKKVQNAMKQLEKGIENSRLNEQFGLTSVDKFKFKASDFKPQWDFNYPNKEPGKARQYDSPIINELLAEIDLDTLKQQAEKMGYELVKKNVNWQDECYSYEISLSGVVVTDLTYDERIFINHLQMPTLIEKYNQFKSNA